MTTKVLAKLFRAVSNEKRLRIIRALLKGLQTINEVADYTGLPYKTVERHLKILISADVVKSNRSGLIIAFTLNTSSKTSIQKSLNSIIKLISTSD